ncbi:hypothetical protein GYMLUDRAFT_887667 [Collybiopsis luxurians FD-317 M1]|uniref:Thaumatin-like protein n=1 Tax=Collybiopsis luxurians FD-317 M1 TaxID=944289 RepID=A0A0D0BK30_9AGAR|nr:hypothetical protein GYMLUDRAFT_887667 [Collybiopsis luxurians FD-317 M1]
MMKFTTIITICALYTTSTWAIPQLVSRDGSHAFTLVNKCPDPVTPVFADTKCGYSPRCADAASFTGPQPAAIAPGKSTTVTVPADWVGRVFAKVAKCGAKGEDCTMAEFNLDTGSQYTAQAYDISNIQGFTQSMSIGAQGCDTVTCTSANCGCKNGYAPGDMSGCGNDSPVRGCGPGNIAFTITFCP